MNGQRREIETRTICQREASAAWRAENPGLTPSECPADQLEFVTYLALVVTYPQPGVPEERWPRHVKPLREIYRAPEHAVFGDLPDAPVLVRPA